MATNPDGPRRVARGLDQLLYYGQPNLAYKKDNLYIFLKYNKNIHELSCIGILV